MSDVYPELHGPTKSPATAPEPMPSEPRPADILDLPARATSGLGARRRTSEASYKGRVITGRFSRGVDRLRGTRSSKGCKKSDHFLSPYAASTRCRHVVLEGTPYRIPALRVQP